MKYNVLQFKANKTAIATAKDALLQKWLRDTRSRLALQLQGIYHSKVGSSDMEIASFSPGKHYHSLIKEGLLTHVAGFNFANHFVKLPLSWASLIHHKETVEGEQVIIYNKDYYSKRFRANKTNCLVWITDDNFAELNPITDNIIAEDKYLTAIKEGGEFYVEPVRE